MQYRISKSKLLNIWIVWQWYGNLEVMVFKAKTKKECKEWLKKHTRVKGVKHH